MVIRDLTLRSAASFGSFHLIRLLYDEYMFFLIEHKVAKATGKTTIAVMSEVGVNLSQTWGSHYSGFLAVIKNARPTNGMSVNFRGKGDKTGEQNNCIKLMFTLIHGEEVLPIRMFSHIKSYMLIELTICP